MAGGERVCLASLTAQLKKKKKEGRKGGKRKKKQESHFHSCLLSQLFRPHCEKDPSSSLALRLRPLSPCLRKKKFFVLPSPTSTTFNSFLRIRDKIIPAKERKYPQQQWETFIYPLAGEALISEYVGFRRDVEKKKFPLKAPFPLSMFA